MWSFYRASLLCWQGQKKFISGAAYADYFTTAVQTAKGVSLLLVRHARNHRRHHRRHLTGLRRLRRAPM